METGIAPSVWLSEDERTLDTAFELLAQSRNSDTAEPIAQG